MPTAYQHRPLSKILAPATDPQAEGSNTDKPRNEQGQFVSPDKTQTAELTEKYKGKTAQEIAEMHMNAEKELGRVRNEVGTYRGLINDLTSLQRQAPESQTVERQEINVSGDELLTDPAGAIDKVVTARLAEREKAEAETRTKTQFETEGAALVAAFPDIDTIVASQEFQEFSARTPSRQQDFLTAAQGKGVEQVRAARRLLEDFKDFQEVQASTVKQGPDGKRQIPAQNADVTAAKAVTTESAGSSGPVSTKPLIYETDVLKLIQTDPTKYRSPSFQTELLAAMREGRYVKQ